MYTQAVNTLNQGAAYNPAPTPISPMQDARGNLSGAVNLLHDRLSELVRRLEPILRPVGPDTVSGSTATPGPVLSEYRQFLVATTGDVQNMTGAVEEILNRLEL